MTAKDGREYDLEKARITYRCAKCYALLFVTTKFEPILQGGAVNIALPRFCDRCTDGHPDTDFR